MMLISTQDGGSSGGILGMSEAEARAALLHFFDRISQASQEFLLGMAMDLAQEDPAPKKQQQVCHPPPPLHLVVG